MADNRFYNKAGAPTDSLATGEQEFNRYDNSLWISTDGTNTTQINVMKKSGTIVSPLTYTDTVNITGLTAGHTEGYAFSTHGGYANSLDILGGIAIQRASDADNTYLLTCFNVAGNIKGFVQISSGDNLYIETSTNSKSINLNTYDGSGNLRSVGMYGNGPDFIPLQDNTINLGRNGLSFKDIFLTDATIINKATGKGIKVDTATPTFPFRDVTQTIQIRTAGASDPTWQTYRGNIKQYQCVTGVTEVFLEIHIPHDYAAGTDIFIHTHWSQITVDTGGTAGAPGVVKWFYEFTYAKGHNQDAFIAPLTASSTVTCSGTQYQHMITETQISTAGGSATNLNTTNIEPDGVILMRAYRDSADAADTANQHPFIHYIDLHYQSTNIGTKAKAPNFYV